MVVVGVFPSVFYGGAGFSGAGFSGAALAVEDALEAYRGSETESANADSDQVNETTSHDKLIKTINTRRSATQHAADAIWPYTDEANAGQRKAFELPQNRPLSL